MPSLKDFRVRIASVKSTRKITSAMKMVAASKLRQAQARAEAGRPYARKMNEALSRLIQAIGTRDEPMPLLDGTGKDRKILYVVVAADRGLAGGFNGNMIREVRRHIGGKTLDNKDVSIIAVGRKARDGMRRDFGDRVIDFMPLTTKYDTAEKLTTRLMELYEQGEFDIAYLGYSEFKNVITQTPTVKQIIPFALPEVSAETLKSQDHHKYNEAPQGVYSFEPSANELLHRLVPQQIAAQLYSVLMEVAAGEQAARMTAMDNATRNAGDMINNLSLQYNRARQAYITKEVSEIVAGAEASA